MERALTYITLDVQKIDSGQQITARRGDSARRLVVSLTSRGRPYIPGEGVTAVFYARKSDGNPCFNAAEIDGCTVTYDFTGQTTNVEGLAACEIRLYDAQNHLLTSPRFEILVDDTEYQEGDVPDSSPEFTALTQMVGEGTAIIGELREALTGLDNVEEVLAQAEAAATAAARSEEAAVRAAGTTQDAVSQSQDAAKRAEDAAKRAEEAAASGSSGGGGISQETDPTVPDWAKQQNKPTYTAAEVGAEPAGTVESSIQIHDVGRYAHNDIRLELQALSDRINAALNSTDGDLDQLAEIVAYIKSNKSLIDAITTSKVSVADIVDNLVTNVSNKPLSAAQGVVLKQLIDGLASGKLDADTLQEAINTALAQAKATGEFDGADGDDGITPHIGGNGNWYLGDTDTGVKAKGADGKDGADGTNGADGRGIKSIARTAGNGAAGTVDTYTITYTDGTSSTYQVRNGANGAPGPAYTLTDADKQSITAAVVAALPKYAGEVEAV